MRATRAVYPDHGNLVYTAKVKDKAVVCTLIIGEYIAYPDKKEASRREPTVSRYNKITVIQGFVSDTKDTYDCILMAHDVCDNELCDALWALASKALQHEDQDVIE